MRYTYPALITSAIKLVRRYKNREHLVSTPVTRCTSYALILGQEDDWQTKAQSILKFVRQLANILATTVEAPSIALRLFLLAAQISDECGFEDLTYDLYVQAFTVYEDSISESRAQLQAITLVIGTLQGARVFSEDNYDTLITKAALHGARLLKKPHQATAVNLASHLWWQEVPPDDEPPTKEPVEKPVAAGAKEEGVDSPKAVSVNTVHPIMAGLISRCSTRTRTANACWSACRRRSVSRTLRRRKL